MLGVGFNFLSETNLEVLAASGMTALPGGCGKPLTLEALVNPNLRLAERAVVTFVLIGFFSYPFLTIFFEKWPVRPGNLPQPQAGLAELGWATTITMFLYVSLIVPFWGLIYGKVFGSSYALNLPWWGEIGGTSHVHWVFGWWEWLIIVLFMTANVWRMKPWSVIRLPQPWKGLISLVGAVVLAYAIALFCAHTWLPQELLRELAQAQAGNAELNRFLWYHAAEIAGFTLIPFLIWHHYFDDMVPMQDTDSWGSFMFRTGGVLVFMVVGYIFFYYANFGHWAIIIWRI